jgi:hypothetical protein
MRIQEAQKHMDLTDPDPQHWLYCCYSWCSFLHWMSISLFQICWPLLWNLQNVWQGNYFTKSLQFFVAIHVDPDSNRKFGTSVMTLSLRNNLSASGSDLFTHRSAHYGKSYILKLLYSTITHSRSPVHKFCRKAKCFFLLDAWSMLGSELWSVSVINNFGSTCCIIVCIAHYFAPTRYCNS